MSCAGCEERAALLSAKFPPLRRFRSRATRAEVVIEARTWIGTPFKHQGYAKGIGTDCIGLVAGVALALGIQGGQDWRDGPYHAYGRPPNPRYLIETADRFLDRIAHEDVQRADILVLSFERDPMHFALVSSIDPLYVIHATHSNGRVVEHRIDAKWLGRVRLAYAYRGLA